MYYGRDEKNAFNRLIVLLFAVLYSTCKIYQEDSYFTANALFLYNNISLDIVFTKRTILQGVDIAESKLFFEDRTKIQYCDLTYMDEKYRKFGTTIFSYNRSFYYFEAKYIHYRSVFFNSWAGIAKFSDGVGIANQRIFNWMGIFEGMKVSNGSVSGQTFHGCFENAILIQSMNDDVYGHMIWDYLGSFIYFPEKVIKKSYIFAKPQWKHLLVDTLYTVYGVRPHKIVQKEYDINDPSSKWWYASNLYTVEQKAGAYTNTAILKNFSKRFAKALIIDKGRPFRYCFHNRNKMTACNRIIPNFDELFRKANEIFPDTSWEMLSDDKTLEGTAKTFNQIRFYVMPTGSGIFNCIFMQKGTVILDIMTHNLCHVDPYVSHEMEIFLVIFSWSDQIEHGSQNTKDFPVVVSEFEHYLSVAMEIDKTKKFPREYKQNKEFKCWKWADEE